MQQAPPPTGVQSSTTSNDVQLAIVQELPTIAIGVIVIIAMTVLLTLHIIAIADATPIYYIVLSYFLQSGTARLVGRLSPGKMASTGGTPP